MAITNLSSLYGVSGGGLAYQVLSVDGNADVGVGYLIDATNENITLTLPASPEEGDTVGVVDAYNKASTNGITIDRNGKKIEGLSENLNINIDGAGLTLVYCDATRGWEIVSEISSNTPQVNYGESFKNKIINGNFDIWQRGTSFAPLTVGLYSADRFVMYLEGTMVHTVTQDSDVPTNAQSGVFSNYSLKIDCTTADAVIAADAHWRLEQKIEGFNYRHLVGKTCTLSFWVKATKTGIHCVAFRNGGQDENYISEYTIHNTNTWEKKEITLTFNQTGGTEEYENDTGLRIGWVLACGADFHTSADTWQSGVYLSTANQVNACDSTDNNFFLSQVQLEANPTVTKFEERSIGTELALCQRYYERWGGATYSGFANGVQIGATEARSYIYYYPKRAIPTITLSGTVRALGSGTNAITSAAISEATPENMVIRWLSTNTNIPTGEAIVAGANNDVTAYLDFDAEL